MEVLDRSLEEERCWRLGMRKKKGKNYDKMWLGVAHGRACGHMARANPLKFGWFCVGSGWHGRATAGTGRASLLVT